MYEGDFFDNFGILDDNRQEAKVQHKLIDIIFIVVSAVISGCNEWQEIHMWESAEVNIDWLKKYIELSNGIPSLSTIGRVFNVINPKQFEKCFIEWMKEVVDLPQKDIVSIDGKTMRGSADEGNSKKGVHIVNAICSSHNLVLGQVKTEEKSNEITAIPELLDLLFIEGTIVTIDAMLCKAFDNMASTVTKLINYMVSKEPNKKAEYRITGYDGENVTFWYESQETKEKVVVTLTAEAFIGKLLMHIPPKYFKMVRT